MMRSVKSRRNRSCSWRAMRTRPTSHFPGLYFQTSFVIAPDGNVVLRYRRLNSMYARQRRMTSGRNISISTASMAFFLWPEPRSGILAAIASEEILYPEIARAHALARCRDFRALVVGNRFAHGNTKNDRKTRPRVRKFDLCHFSQHSRDSRYRALPRGIRRRQFDGGGLERQYLSTVEQRRNFYRVRRHRSCGVGALRAENRG